MAFGNADLYSKIYKFLKAKTRQVINRENDVTFRLDEMNYKGWWWWLLWFFTLLTGDARAIKPFRT